MRPPLLLLAALLGCQRAVIAIPPPPGADRPPVSATNAEARRLYLLGRIQLHQGQLTEARQAFTQARRFDPDSGAIVMALGDVALAAREVGEARRLWQEAVELEPTLASAWLRLARAERAHGDLVFAVEAYRQAVDLGVPWQARAELAELLVLMDRDDDARAVITAWVETGTELERPAWRRRAELRLRLGDREGAWEDLRHYVEEQPEDFEAIDSFLRISVELAHAGTALAVLDGAAAALPAEPAIARRQVAFADEVGHAARQLDALDRLQQLLGVDDPGLDLDRARALLRLKRPAEALAVLDRIAAVAPGWPRLGLWRAEALLALDRPAEARAVLAETPDQPGALPWRVDLLRRAGEGAEARRLLEAALTERPDVRPLVDAAMRQAAAELDHDWGLALAATRSTEPEELWRRALAQAGHDDLVLARMAPQVDAGDPTALRDSASLLIAEQPQEAVDRLRRALAASPEDTRTRRLLAGALVELGLSPDGTDAQLEEARGLAEDLLADAPTDAGLLNLVAWSCAAADQCLDRAERLARRAVDASPGDPHVLDTLGWTLARQGRLPAARRLLEEALRLAPDQVEISRHLSAVESGVLPPPRSPAP